MYVLYEGPSLIDGTPIVVLATGIDMPSANRKTGPMVQTYIMARDIHPVEAVNTGADLAICGDCVHRGSRTRKRSCYVTVHQGPTSVWRAYQRNPNAAVPLNEIANLGRLRHIRLGAYGDPTAAPTEIWSHLLRHAQSHTGYTHLWRTCAPQFKAWCMASVDSASERREAKNLGWRTFHILPTAAARGSNEVICPASAQSTVKTPLTCIQCGACNGNSKAFKGDVAIQIHGPKWKQNAFLQIRAGGSPRPGQSTLPRLETTQHAVA